MTLAFDELPDSVIQYRRQTFRSAPGLRLHSQEDALDFVNERGFALFWPIKSFAFPSLWEGVTGKNVVADNHDDPGHVTWDWKDSALGKKLWYYGRVLKHKNAMLSLEAVPYFYALTPNYGEFESDYLIQYEQGQMTAEAKAVYEALLFNGPMDTLMLRKTARMTNESSSSRFQRALDHLQMEMKILPVGISEAGAWKYAFMFDIVPRHFPWIEEAGGKISEPEARAWLLTRYLRSLGLDECARIRSMFRWSEIELSRAIRRVTDDNRLELAQISLRGKPALALSDLL